VQLAELVCTSNRHSFSGNNLPTEWLNDLALWALNHNNVAVKVRNKLLKAKQGFLQGDFKVVIQIVTDALEQWVLLLTQLKNDIRLKHIKHLFTLSFESNGVTGVHATFYLNDELFVVVNKPLSLTVLAVLFVDSSFALAIPTRLLHLHLHKAHLDILDGHPLAVALGTNLLLATLST
jgi:hypothetical protein